MYITGVYRGIKLYHVMQWGYSNMLKYSSKTFIYLIIKEGHVQNDNEKQGVGVGIQILQLHKEKRGRKKKAADQIYLK